MAKRKLFYLLAAVSATGAGAAAFVYRKNNETFELQNNRIYNFNSKNRDENGLWYNGILDPRYSINIDKARDLVLRFKDEIGAPGMVVGVSVNGKSVWTEGVGMADVENRVPCHPGTVMRIASISKSMTMAVVAKLWEEGKLDLDKPIQEYVPKFPVKMYDGKEVIITPRMLASHLSGIRHYTKKGEKEGKDGQVHDTLYKEFYLKDKFESVNDALQLFQDDELMSKPGTTYLYSTHGFTLLSAAVEGAAKEPFTKLMKSFFKTMGFKSTYLDENDAIIYHRSRYYKKNNKSRLINVPFADNSYKWAGGGFLSNVSDLLQFCNAMLVSYQSKTKQGYLQPDTVQALWTLSSKEGYGLGWFVVPPKHEFQGCEVQHFSVGHTGGAVGASSVIVMLPTDPANKLPSGISVAIITNLQDIGMRKLGLDVAEIFLEDS